ncbi:MAG: hypothetical protein EOP04_17180 [Proteobacteria bacterium]|nr:MAG: hypothetical protein EOP04_17180 [Pseudomonadota bacterium]
MGFHSHTQAQKELKKFMNRNPDISMLISDDFNARRNDPFLLTEQREYNYFENQILWIADTPMDQDTLSGVLNSNPVHSLTLCVKNQKSKPRNYELNEEEIIAYVNDTKFMIFSIFDSESYLILELP